MKQPAHARCARAAQIFPAFSQLFFRVFFFGFALVGKNIRGKIEKQKKTISNSSNFSAIQFAKYPQIPKKNRGKFNLGRIHVSNSI